jgi:hypothetical protein
MSKEGGGNMINKMSNVTFYDAKVGIFMGGDYPNTDSDMHYEFLTFCHLDTGFISTHLQAVNYQFDWIFGLNCDTVFHFKAGGNALINNAQLTMCLLAVWIEGGDKNSGTFLIDNMRQEGGGHKGKRLQALRVATQEQAVVHFINYDDVQWYWPKGTPNPAEMNKPLCEIGPGATVVFDSSIFSGPLASLTGKEGDPAELVVRQSNFNNILPQNAVSADEHSYFKLLDNRVGGGKLIPDTVKWPQDQPVMLTPDTEYKSTPNLGPPNPEPPTYN